MLSPSRSESLSRIAIVLLYRDRYRLSVSLDVIVIGYRVRALIGIAIRVRYLVIADRILSGIAIGILIGIAIGIVIGIVIGIAIGIGIGLCDRYSGVVIAIWFAVSLYTVGYRVGLSVSWSGIAVNGIAFRYAGYGIGYRYRDRIAIGYRDRHRVCYRDHFRHRYRDRDGIVISIGIGIAIGIAIGIGIGYRDHSIGVVIAIGIAGLAIAIRYRVSVIAAVFAIIVSTVGYHVDQYRGRYCGIGYPRSRFIAGYRAYRYRESVSRYRYRGIGIAVGIAWQSYSGRWVIAVSGLSPSWTVSRYR
ncbi:hypothetical protein Tco_0516614 [Tanacetum coccineum]